MASQFISEADVEELFFDDHAINEKAQKLAWLLSCITEVGTDR